MANCAYRITKNGSNYGIAINVSDTASATDLVTNYGDFNIYVNGKIRAVEGGGSWADGIAKAGFQAEPVVTLATNQYYGFGTFGASYGKWSIGTYNNGVRFIFNHKDNTSNSIKIQFALPTAANDSTASGTYNILTSKNLVTVDQGGTGLSQSPSVLTNLGSTTASNILAASPRPGVTGTLGAGNGGTGQTTLKLAATSLLQNLDVGSSTPVDGDVYISSYANGSGYTTSVTYYRRKVDSLFDYVKGKLGTAATHAHGDYVQMTGNQTVGGTKTFTNPIVKGDSASLYFQTSASGTQTFGRIFFYGAVTSDKKRPSSMYFLHNSYNSTTGVVSTFYEEFHLPSVTADRTTSSDFAILTSKSAVTVAQGGTGKTTATEAWTALGGGASGKHADSYFALASHNHAAGDINSGILALARGGTGQSALESSALTYATNSHITSAQMSANMKVFKFGKIGMLVSTGASLAAHSESTWVKIGSVPAAYKPAMNATNRIPVSNTNWRIQIDTSGNVNVYKSTSDTTLFYCSFAYPLA